MKQLFKFLLLFSASSMIACGGSNDSSTPTPAPPTPPATGSSEPTWTQGTYPTSSTFKNQCAAPRTTTDIDGNAYPDEQGSTLKEKFWLRSWSDELYLWYNEITDTNPDNNDDRLEYFERLRTTATTTNGTQKDQFHFTIPTDEYEERVATGASAGYGADFVILAGSPPRDVRVSLVQPNSPASTDSSLLRGTEILEVDGEDVVNGSDTNALNAGLFPSQPGETHTFLVKDAGSEAIRSVSLTSAVVAEQPVNTTTVIDTPTGKVGYIAFTTFGTSTAEEQIANAFTEMSNANISDLVLDLRYNGGGFLAIASQLSFMIAGENQTQGTFFEELQFNDKHPVTNPVTNTTLEPTPFYTTSLGFNENFPGGQPLNTVDLERVFIISTARTCSASEAVINGLRGIDVEVILIGSRTCGKPYGFYGTDNCGETYFTIQFRGVNYKNFGDYSDGFAPENSATTGGVGEFIPGCLAGDDFTNQLGSTNENMFSTALSYRENGVCPANQNKDLYYSNKFKFENNPSQSLYSEKRIENMFKLKNSRIIRKTN